MGRVKDLLIVNKRKLFTLFDTGSVNSYITFEAARKVGITTKDGIVFKVAIGGKRHVLKQRGLVEGKLHGKHVTFHAFVIDAIGSDEKGNKIDLLFGALAMQQWGIEINPSREKISLTYYPKEFVEF